MEDDLLTIKEVAAYFKVGRQTVHRWMARGILPYVVIGFRRRVPRSAVLAFVKPGPGQGESK
jgi:excisionase family DNA binding protein